mmetsp:Transcript_42400/g.99533  ORF Transcript_42400/g.99533 Transcript_42400/m.99533 type:complete len:368 (-) Transcript_42400:1563-2666(-)
MPSTLMSTSEAARERSSAGDLPPSASFSSPINEEDECAPNPPAAWIAVVSALLELKSPALSVYCRNGLSSMWMPPARECARERTEAAVCVAASESKKVANSDRSTCCNHASGRGTSHFSSDALAASAASSASASRRSCNFLVMRPFRAASRTLKPSAFALATRACELLPPSLRTRVRPARRWKRERGFVSASFISMSASAASSSSSSTAGAAAGVGAAVIPSPTPSPFSQVAPLPNKPLSGTCGVSCAGAAARALSLRSGGSGSARPPTRSTSPTRLRPPPRSASLAATAFLNECSGESDLSDAVERANRSTDILALRPSERGGGLACALRVSPLLRLCFSGALSEKSISRFCSFLRNLRASFASAP